VDHPSRKRGVQVDLSGMNQVVPSSLEARVLLLFDLELYIARLDARNLIPLGLECNLMAIRNAAVNRHVEHLALNDGFLTLALLAAVFVAEDLTLALAVRADRLESLDHGSHLAHHHLHALAVAARASLYGTSLAAAAIAVGADDGLLQGQLRDLAVVDVLEGYLVDVVNGAGFLGARVAHAAAEHASEATPSEELGEEIFGAHSAGSALLRQALFAILVVDGALLRIRQDFVGGGNVLEQFRCLGVAWVLI
jgi:hypothetical protein